jgi:hypothetical protein
MGSPRLKPDALAPMSGQSPRRLHHARAGDVIAAVAARKRRFVSGVGEAKNSASERNCFAERNERFREGVVSHWNHWGAKSGNFAGLFIFNGLSSISFRGFAACDSGSPSRAAIFAIETPVLSYAMIFRSRSVRLKRAAAREAACAAALRFWKSWTFGSRL